MKNLWYAVMADRKDDDWGTGSADLKTAKELCRKAGTDAYIAVIDESSKNPVCIAEIEQSEF